MKSCKGTNCSFSRAVRLRRLLVVGNPDFNVLRELLVVPFVRNGRPTVVPFPVKLLRTWREVHLEEVV